MSNISKSTPAPTMNPEMGELQSLQTALCDMLRDSITDMEGNLEQLQTHRKLLSEVYKPYKKKADALSAKYRYTEYMRESEVIRTQEVRKTQLYFNARNLINRFIREIHASTESQFSVLVNTQQDQTDSTVGGVDDVRTSLSQQNEIVDILAIDKESHDSAKCSSSDTNNRADRERLPSIPSLEDTNPPSQKEALTPPPNRTVATTQPHEIEEFSTSLHEVKRVDNSPLKITEVSTPPPLRDKVSAHRERFDEANTPPSMLTHHLAQGVECREVFMPPLDEVKVTSAPQLNRPTPSMSRTTIEDGQICHLIINEDPSSPYTFRNMTGAPVKLKWVSKPIPSGITAVKDLGPVESHRSLDSGRPPEGPSMLRKMKRWLPSLGKPPELPYEHEKLKGGLPTLGKPPEWHSKPRKV